MQSDAEVREIYRECVKAPSTIRHKARQFARDRALDCLSALPRASQSNSLRFLYAHYVFDDQCIDFESHLKTLMQVGKFVNTETAISMLNGEREVDGQYFHLSFDDGLACLFRNAVPVLNKYSIPAIVFVNSAVAGTPLPEERVAWDEGTNYKKPLQPMSWEMLAESGLEVGAHTRTHPRLSRVSNSQNVLKSEIAGCKAEIEDRLEVPCRYFAWPFGQLADIDSASFEEIKRAGFEAAFGAYRDKTVPGNANLFSIPRHHFEPEWPVPHVRYFATGGMEKRSSKHG